MEAISVATLTAPILLTAAIELGFDPIWDSVVMVEAALMTSLVGLNVHVMTGMNKDIPILYLKLSKLTNRKIF